MEGIELLEDNKKQVMICRGTGLTFFQEESQVLACPSDRINSISGASRPSHGCWPRETARGS